MVTQHLPSTDPDTCHGVIECASADLLALGAAVFVLCFVATVVDLRRALSVVDGELARITDEADALEAFGERVAELDAIPAGAAASQPGAATLVEAGGTSGLRQVREAYRGTLMAVPHYEAEYGESLPENMAVEFGDDVAGAVAGSTALTPQLKETILQRTRQARDKRRVLAGYLEDEASAVSAARTRLQRVANSSDRVADEPLSQFEYDDLRAEWYLLADRQEECQQVLADRQETIQGRRDVADRVDVVDSMEEYLYEPMDVSYPVLAQATSLADRLDDLQARIATSMTRRR